MAKNTSGKQGERELKKRERDIYSLVALRIGWLQNTPLTQDPFLFGTRLGFVDHDSHCCTHKVKEAIHIRLHPANISGHDEIEIPEAWMCTIKKHNSRLVTKWSYERTPSKSQNNHEYRNDSVHSIPVTTNWDSFV